MSQPTNDPHPTARALVEAWECREGEDGTRILYQLDNYDVDDIKQIRSELVSAITEALTAARREGREEMRESAAVAALCCTPASRNNRPWLAAQAAIAKDIRQLPVDDAARGEG